MTHSIKIIKNHTIYHKSRSTTINPILSLYVTINWLFVECPLLKPNWWGDKRESPRLYKAEAEVSDIGLYFKGLFFEQISYTLLVIFRPCWVHYSWYLSASPGGLIKGPFFYFDSIFRFYFPPPFFVYGYLKYSKYHVATYSHGHH